MILDKELQFCENQAVTANAASTNAIDFKSAGVGRGEPVQISVVITEAFNNLTDLTVSIQGSSDDGDTDAYADVISSPAVPLAALVDGYEFVLTVLPEKLERYGRLYFTVNGTAPTTGQITANVVADRQTNY